MENKAIKFIPVMGKDSKILSTDFEAGRVYFATDTGKIYVDTLNNENKVLMGRASGVYYCNIPTDEDATSINFNFVDVDGGIPNIGDLLINGSDSSFYKVTQIDADAGSAIKVVAAGKTDGSRIYSVEVDAVEQVDGTYSIGLDTLVGSPKVGDIILTISGALYHITELEDNTAVCSVISSGSGGNGSSTTTDRLTVKLTGIHSYDVLIKDQNAFVSVMVTSEHSEIVKIPVTVTINNSYGGETNIYTKQFTVDNNVPYDYNLGPELPLGTNKVTFAAVTEYEGNEIKGVNSLLSLSTVVMSLDKSSNFNQLRVWDNKGVDFRCIPIGQGISKTLYIEVDGKRRNDLTKTNILTSGAEVQVNITGLSHGMHTVKAILTANDDMIQTSLLYQVACREEGNLTPILWCENANISIVDHEPMVVNYMVYDPASPARTSVTYYVNGSILSTGTIDAAYSATAWIPWRIAKYNLGENELVVMCSTESLSLVAKVAKDDRDLDVISSGIILNLEAEGRSNKENISSRGIWHTEGKDDYVTFNNFNWYNNGWIMDDDGNTCLRVSNGASVSIPLNILKDSKLRSSYTMEFIFKIRNVKKYSALITTVEDEETHETHPVVSSEEGVCLRYYNAHVGWCLGTQETFFTSKNTTISGRYVEDEVVHLSYVIEDPSISAIPLCYIYLNGLLTGVTTYNPTTDSFNSERELKAMTINSDYCDIDIYKIRIYESSLMAKDIVHNYIADKLDIDLYDANQIVEYHNNIPNIDFKLMRQYNIDHPEAPMMPYAVIETTDVENTLPFKKMEDKDLESYDAAKEEWVSRKAWSVNIDFVNPALDYAYEKKLITDEQYIKGCPSYTSTGVELNVQGTSSQGYPRRNYKAKFKKADSWLYTNGPLAGKKIGSKNKLNDVEYKNWYMDSEIPTNKFTWKADYMESSGTHNGGLASFLGTVYSKHPLEDYGVSKAEADKYRTSVYGFPMMVFHKKSGGTGNGEMQFIGRYIYLLDKSCDDNFGFSGVDVDSKVSDGEGGKLALEDVAECWQIEDNQGGRCSFKCNYEKEDGSPDYEKILTDTYVTTDGRTTLGIGRDFSVRYHADKDDIELAIDQRHDFQNNPTTANAYLKEKYKNLADLVEWVASTDTSKATNKPLPIAKYGYTTDSREYRLAKFTNEFTEHLDLHYSIIYFIITEILMCFDSRGKNMMIATWGPQKEGGNYIWYPIFYDMDTQLGINNSGVPYWDYYEEVTNRNTFSTPDSVLWNNLWSCFKTQILTAYSGLRTNILTETQLNGYYDFDPLISKSYAMQGIRPLIMKNIDEYYKYIDCAIGGGYKDTSNETITTTGYFYCLQGDRKMRRNMLLRNRFNYYDSMWMGGNYTNTTVVGKTNRAGANNWSSTSDKYLNIPESEWTQDLTDAGFERVDSEKANPLDAEWDFELTPYLKQYVSVYFDKTATPNKYCEDGESAIITCPDNLKNALNTTANKQDQIFYFGGMPFLSSFGDLSTKYIDKLDLASAKRLKDLILGSDVDGYFNNRLKNGENFTVEDNAKLADGTVNPNAKTLLEKVVLSNLGGLTDSLDFSGSEKLKEVRALGTNLQSVDLADGVQIEKLFLPNTITNIQLIEPTSLTGYLTEKPIAGENGEYPKGLYLEGITDNTIITDATTEALNTINIIGGSMGYNSYKLTKTALAIKESMIRNYANLDNTKISRELEINLERVNWSPYRLVEHGETVNPNATYVLKTPHFSFEDYTPTNDDWNKNTLNSKVYEYIATNDMNVVTDLSLLDKLIAHYEEHEGYIHGNNGNDSIPYISGTMFINNDAAHPIHETELRDKYMGTYFPDLNITVANPAGDNIVQFIEIMNDIELEVDTLAYGKDAVHVSETEKVPSTRPHYDWLGWAETPNGSIITDWSKYKFSETVTSYIFYAVYDNHHYDNIFLNSDGSQFELIKVKSYEHCVAPSRIPTKDDANILQDPTLKKDENEVDYTYRFMGWSNEENGTIIDVTDYISTMDRTFYPIFKAIGVHSSATSSEYFNISSSGTVSPKPGVILSGKITIDSSIGGIPVRSIAGFNEQEISRLYFMKGTNLTTINDYCFNNNQFIKYVEFMPSLVTIGEQAFNGCGKLESCDLSLCNNLITIKDNAFNSAFGPKVTRVYIPGNVTTIGARAFAYAPSGTDINEIIIGSETDPTKLSSVGEYAFYQNSYTESSNMILTIYARSGKDYYSWLIDKIYYNENDPSKSSSIAVRTVA